MKKIFWSAIVVTVAIFFTAETFAKCQYWGPPLNRYGCYGDDEGAKKKTTVETPAQQQKQASGCNQLDLTISCAGSGSAVDWINTCSLDCGDGNRYDAIAVQKDSATLSCWHRQVPPNSSCSVTVGSGTDSKEVGSVQTSGNCKKFLRGQCAW